MLLCVVHLLSFYLCPPHPPSHGHFCSSPLYLHSVSVPSAVSSSPPGVAEIQQYGTVPLPVCTAHRSRKTTVAPNQKVMDDCTWFLARFLHGTSLVLSNHAYVDLYISFIISIPHSLSPDPGISSPEFIHMVTCLIPPFIWWSVLNRGPHSYGSCEPDLSPFRPYYFTISFFSSKYIIIGNSCLRSFTLACEDSLSCTQLI